ncbi:MAG: NF038122 family metalloprotease, partial [Limisphaerales bacterium]
QTVTIPLAISSATLSFYYNISSAETNTTALDIFTATIQDTNGTVLATVGNWSNLNRDPAPGNPNYHQQTFNLTAYAGKTIRIAFASQNNATLITSFFVDDVTVQTTAATGPADLMPQKIFLMPTPALAGGQLTVMYTVANIGGTAAPASHTKVQIIDSANTVLNQQIFSTAAVPASSSTNEMHNMSLAGAAAGSYTVVVTADCNSEASQTNRSNDVSAPAPMTVQPPAGLVIHPIFDSTITTDPNSALIQNALNAAITAYEWQFSDPITVNIQFSKMTNGLGQSTTYGGTIAYSDFVTALAADSMTTNDAIALNYLPATTSNPANGNPSVTLTTANLRALGINVSPPNNQYDSYIALNFAIMNLTRANVDPTKYDLSSVVQHEIDEALGLNSSLNNLNNGAPTPTGPVHVMDVFRYDQNGTRSFNTASNSQAYLSIDGGTTDLVRFNQTQVGDFQDWYSGTGHTPRVQDAWGTPGATPNLGVELIALDVSGYNFVCAIPKPEIIGMAPSGNNMNVTWASEPNLSYQLQSKATLLGGWTNLGSPVTSTGTTTTAAAAITSAQSYFRVVLMNGSQTSAIKTAIVSRATASMARQSSAMHELPPQSHAQP